MPSKRRKRPMSLLRSVIFLAVMAVVGYAGAKVVPVVVRTFRFSQAIQHEVLYGPANESISFIRNRLTAEASRLGLDVEPQDLVIEKNGPSLKISASYVVTIELAGGYDFDWRFDPSYQGIRRPPAFGGS